MFSSKRDYSEMEDGNASGCPPAKRKQPPQAEIAFLVKAKVALLGLAVQKEALRQQFGKELHRLREIDVQMNEYKETLRRKNVLGCDFTENQENYIRRTVQRRIGL